MSIHAIIHPESIIRLRICILSILLIVLRSFCYGQDNYEIQVYGSDLVPVGSTMIELHSNYTAIGSTMINDGVRPTQGAEHETIEITHGFTPWFEVGFYYFSSFNPKYGYQWVGDHIRPRFAVPESLNWPVGLSLSTEFGYQRPEYCDDEYTLELRPIIDKKIKKWYFSLNPVIDYAFKGFDAGKGGEFSPNVKFSFDVTKEVALGLEYYGSLGPVTGFFPYQQQQHQVFPAIDLNLSPDWEFNFGVGKGFTSSTDGLIFKMILGRRLSGNNGHKMKKQLYEHKPHNKIFFQG